MRYLITTLASIGSLPVFAIFYFLFYFSWTIFQDIGFIDILISPWEPKDSFGLSFMIVGSLIIAIVSTTLAFIYSLSIALSYNRLKEGKVKQYLDIFLNITSSIPTIVYGFLGVVILLPYMGELLANSGSSLLSTSLVLSFLITPTMSLFFINSFATLKSEYNTIVQSLGGDLIDYQIKILLPNRLKSITIGFMMGFSRAIGDTMIALMLAGNSLFMPTSLNDSGRVLTSHIALLFSSDFDSIEFRSIFASGFVLFCISFVLLIGIRYLRKDSD